VSLWQSHTPAVRVAFPPLPTLKSNKHEKALFSLGVIHCHKSDRQQGRNHPPRQPHRTPTLRAAHHFVQLRSFMDRLQSLRLSGVQKLPLAWGTRVADRVHLRVCPRSGLRARRFFQLDRVSRSTNHSVAHSPRVCLCPRLRRPLAGESLCRPRFGLLQR